MPDLSQLLGIENLLKNANVSQLGVEINPTAASYSELTKFEFFWWKKTIRKVKTIKRANAFKSYVYSYNVEILKFFTPELQLKNTELAIKNETIKLVAWIEMV